MHTHRFHIIALAVFLLSTASCSSRFYVPIQHNVPLFHEKGELRLSAGRSGGDDVTGTEVQGAYALTDQLGVIGNVFTATAGDNSGSHGYFLEGGTGYFRQLSNRVAFETYGGAGIGRAVNGPSNLRLSKFFAQPDIGYSSRFFDAAISMRAALLHYSNIPTPMITAEPIPGSPVDYIRQHPTSVLIEPAYLFRVGWKQAKAQVQISTSYNLTAPQLQQEKVMLSLSFYFRNRAR